MRRNQPAEQGALCPASVLSLHPSLGVLESRHADTGLWGFSGPHKTSSFKVGAMEEDESVVLPPPPP